MSDFILIFKVSPNSRRRYYVKEIDDYNTEIYVYTDGEEPLVDKLNYSGLSVIEDNIKRGAWYVVWRKEDSETF